MGAVRQLLDHKLLRGLVPLDGLSPHNFNEVVSRLQIKHFDKGQYVFREGEHDAYAMYLVEGKIELIGEGKKAVILRAGSHEASYALAPQQPRPVNAIAKTAVTITYIDKTLLDVYCGNHQENAYQVQDIGADGDDDWMTRLLQSDAFLRLPPMNIQRLLTRMQALELKAKEVVIREGEDGDAYYTVKQGRCRISRSKPDGTSITLAEIGSGACFGEDALLSESKRSATVTMLTDGELMRLSKKDFLELLNDPLINHVNFNDAKALIEKGAKWLDTRSAAEHAAEHIKGSLHLPLPDLRDRLGSLDKKTLYITYCENGRTSAAAAFVLGQHGIDSRVLSNGLATVDSSLIEVTNEPPAGKPDAASLATAASAKEQAKSAEIIGFKQPLDSKHISEIKQLRADLENLRNLSDTRLKHAKLQAHEQIEKLKNELQQAQDKFGESSQSAKSEIDRLKNALDEEQQNAAAISTNKSELENSLAKLERELQAAQLKETHLKKALDDAIAELDSNNEKQQTAKQEIEHLRSALSDSQSKLQALSKTEKQSDDQLSQYRQDVERLQAELNDLQNKIQLNESELKSSQTAKADISRAEQEARKALDESRADIDRLKQKLDEAITKQRHAEQEITILRGKLEGGKEAQKIVVDKLKQQLSNASDEYQKLMAEKETLAGRLGEIEQQLSAEKHAYQTLQSELAKGQSELTVLQQQHGAAQQHNSELEQNIEALKAASSADAQAQENRIKELLDSIEEVRKSELALQQDNNELKLRLEAAARENERLQVSISGEIDAEIARLLEEIKLKSSQLTQAQMALERSNGHRGELEQRISAQERLLQEQEHGSQQRLDALTKELSTTQKLQQEAQTAADQHLAALGQLKSELLGRQDELNARQAELAQLRDHFASVSETKASLENTVAQLQHEKNELGKKIDSLETEVSLLRSEHSDSNNLQALIDSLKEDNEKQREVSHGIEQALAEKQREIERLNNELSGNHERLADLQTRLAALEQEKLSLLHKLETQQATIDSWQKSDGQNDELLQRIDTLNSENETLRQSAAHNDQRSIEAEKTLAALEQEKSQLDGTISSQQQVIDELNGKIAELNQQYESIQQQNGHTEHQSSQQIAELQRQLASGEKDHKAQINSLQEQLDSLLKEKQQLGTTLEEVHERMRADRLGLETQLTEQSLLKNQAETQHNDLKQEVEGLRAELETANKQLRSALDSNEQSVTHSTQLQRLSADLAKAVEYRKQSELAKQELQDEIVQIRKEMARLKGENDAHLELRIQLEGQLSILRRQLSTHGDGPGIKGNGGSAVTIDDSGIVSLTDIGLTTWESKPKKRRNYLMPVAAAIALVTTVSGAWFFKEPLGLTNNIDALLKPSQQVPQVNVAETSELAPEQTVGSAAAALPQLADPNPVQAAPDKAGALIAVTPTSREVSPVPFRNYRNALKDGGAGPVMVEMPEGRFTMGSSVTSNYFEERPQRDVEVKRFAVSKHEITFAEYEKFAKAMQRPIPDDEGWGRGDQPIINVSWQNAVDYTNWLSEQTGISYRLPSEAEWEYMARGGTQATYWWGNGPRPDYANCHDCEGTLAGKQPLKVDSYDANPFGIKNSAGNVAEWVQDCYHASYENAPLDSKAWVTDGQCNKRIVRGGSYRSSFTQLRSSARDAYDLTTRSDTIGFRVVRDY